MNYYERHIGDYLKNTTHLTLLEHGVYSRLLDVYYIKEEPIPDDKAERLVVARTKEEKLAVRAVLEEFFILEAGFWHQERCDEELARYKEGEPEREVKKANTDNRMKRHREERASLFKVLTDAGQHADWNIRIADLRELAKRVLEPEPATAPVTQPVTAPATPATATQTPYPDTIPNEEKEISTLAGAPQRPSADGPQLSLVGTPPKASVYRRPACPTAEIVELYHQHLPGLPRVDILSDGRKRHVSARWAAVCGESKYDRAQGLEWFAWFFSHVAKSGFLTGRVKGRSGDAFRCTFDFLMTPEKFVRVVENFYHKDSA
jgi:uncharacterized protein YdaU (DUF1376 family)